MRIAVVSDIHYPKRLFAFPDSLASLIKYDMVIGLGDYVIQDVIDFLKGVAKKSFFVSGNADESFIRASYPEKLILNIEGLSIGVIHGYGPPNKLAKKLLNEFDNIDIMLYGHTHISCSRRIGSIQVFNPGAFSETMSVGILELENGKILDWRIECLK
jgi:putative phosphoesterase